MNNSSKQNQLTDLLQSYEIRKLYTSIKEPNWEEGIPITGFIVSHQFHSINRFVSFLRDLNSVCSEFKLKPIAPNLYHGNCTDIQQMACESNYFCCYTAKDGWLY